MAYTSNKTTTSAAGAAGGVLSSESFVGFSLDDAITEMQRKGNMKQQNQNQNSRRKLQLTQEKVLSGRRDSTVKEVTKSLRVGPEAEADPYDCLNAKFSSRLPGAHLTSSMRSLQHNLKLCNDVEQQCKKKDNQKWRANSMSTTEPNLIMQQRNGNSNKAKITIPSTTNKYKPLTTSQQKQQGSSSIMHHSLLPQQNSLPTMMLGGTQSAAVIQTFSTVAVAITKDGNKLNNLSVEENDDEYFKQQTEQRSAKTPSQSTAVQPTALIPINFLQTPALRQLTAGGAGTGTNSNVSNSLNNFNRSSAFCSSRSRRCLSISQEGGTT